MKLNLPKQIKNIGARLIEAGYEAYIVGGCVRDLILNIKPNDWDLTTSAPPEKIQELFEHTVYENKYGTVGIVLDDENDPTLKLIEITPYRKDGIYKDNRHPTSVTFCSNINDDLKRRDFTINALAYNIDSNELIDLFGGIRDINRGIIKTVNDPDERFNEDALRILRAIRFAARFNVEIEKETKESIKKNKALLLKIAPERIRDEFVKIVETKNALKGIVLMEELGILELIIPELREGIGMEQNQAHMFTVFEHLIKTFDASVKKELSLILKFSALFHDIGKPRTREWQKKKNDWSFHNHEVVGAKMTEKILKRLKFSTSFTKEVVKFVRWHMFFSDPEQISLAGVRKMLVRIGDDKIWDLIDLRVCDRIGTGRPKEEPYRLRKYKSMVEEALKTSISPKQLKVNGNNLMKELNLPAGKWLGQVLIILLFEAIESPNLNTQKILIDRAKELVAMDKEELFNLFIKAKKEIYAIEQSEIKEIRKKYYVK